MRADQMLTGAAGGLGQVLRESLRPFTATLQISDIEPLTAAREAEEIVPCDLADKAAVDALVRGCDAVVHMGGISTERPFEEVLEANIKGPFNLYEGARSHGVKRIVFASSNHVVGFHQQGEMVDAGCAKRPDCYYEPRDRRMLVTRPIPRRAIRAAASSRPARSRRSDEASR